MLVEPAAVTVGAVVGPFAVVGGLAVVVVFGLVVVVTFAVVVVALVVLGPEVDVRTESSMRLRGPSRHHALTRDSRSPLSNKTSTRSGPWLTTVMRQPDEGAANSSEASSPANATCTRPPVT